MKPSIRAAVARLTTPKRRRYQRGLIVAGLALAASACTEQPKADPSNVQQVASGKRVYETQCASCHGTNLEGQPNWRERLPNGKFPAPPHDKGGHTWHHSDALLFDIVKNGIEGHAPPGYRSDMPAFRGRLTDEEIWAVLSYIKSSWPAETQRWQADVSAKDTRVRR
jgi:S-disulfanyl-L-cysteine oxidoreductase SoxD